MVSLPLRRGGLGRGPSRNVGRGAACCALREGVAAPSGGEGSGGILFHRDWISGTLFLEGSRRFATMRRSKLATMVIGRLAESRRFATMAELTKDQKKWIDQMIKKKGLNEYGDPKD